MSDRKVSDKNREHERTVREGEDERLAETERRAEQLREAWRQRHPEREGHKDRPKKGGAA